MKIRWIGQSGYLLSDGKKTICIDPYLSDVVNRIAKRPRMKEIPIKPERLKTDIVVCTHNHLDHLDIDAIPLMNKNIMFLAPIDCEQSLKDLGVLKYTPFDEGEVFILGDFIITAVFAAHTVPAIGVLVEHKGKRFYFSGDTIYNKRLENIRCDYMFVCINGKLGNMNVNDAILLTNKIRPKVAVPNHYDMFASNSEDPQKYTKCIANGFIMEFNKEYEVSDGCLI